MTVVIDPIYGCPRWSLAHIFDEILKRCFPSFTDTYSPSAICRKLFIVVVGAPLFHRFPDVVEACAGLTVFSVNDASQASATAPITARQISGWGNDCISTIAETRPKHATYIAASNFKDGKATKFLPKKVGSFHGKTILHYRSPANP